MLIFLKFIKFGVVGFLGLIIDFSITYLLKEKLKINRFISNSIGFSFAVSSNYYLNRIWTFHSENNLVVVEFSTFVLVSLVGLSINNASIFLIEKKYNFYVAKFLAIILTMFWNFFANYYITFQQ